MKNDPQAALLDPPVRLARREKLPRFEEGHRTVPCPSCGEPTDLLFANAPLAWCTNGECETQFFHLGPRSTRGDELPEHIEQRRLRLAARQMPTAPQSSSKSPKSDPVDYAAGRSGVLTVGLVLAIGALIVAAKLFISLGWIR